MDYQNQSLNNFEEKKEVKSRKSNTIFLVLILIIIILSLFLGTSYKKHGVFLSEKEKMAILDELIKNSDADKYTYEEKLDILKKLSETRDGDKKITIEEKKEILDSITK